MEGKERSRNGEKYIIEGRIEERNNGVEEKEEKDEKEVLEGKERGKNRKKIIAEKKMR